MAALRDLWRRNRFVGLMLMLGLVLAGLGEVSLNWVERRARQQAEVLATQRVGLRADAAQHLVETLLQGMEPLFAQGEYWYRLHPGYGEPTNPYRTEIEERIRWSTSVERFGVFQLAVIDAHGIGIWSSVGGNTSVNLADREHFKAHLGQDIGTFVSRPLLGRVSQRWSIQLSRRINDGDGQFVGVVVLSLDPFKLAQELSRLRGAGEQDVALYRADGLLLTRSAGLEHALEQQFVARALPGADGRLDIRSVGRLTGEDRFLAMRRVGSGAFLVSVSALAERQLADHRRFVVLLHWAKAILLLVMLGGGALVLIWRAKNRAAAGALVLRQRAEEQARVLDALPMAVYISRMGPRVARRLTFTNVHFEKLRRAVPGSPALDYLQHPPLSAAERAAFQAELEQNGELTQERQYRHLNGSLRWARWDAKVIGRPQGELEALITVTDIETEKAAAVAVATTSRLATLGEVSAALAHELNQPLTVISLSAEISQMLAQDCPPGTAEPLLARQQVIVDMVQRVKTITDHLRLFSRNDADEQHAVDLARVMRGTLALINGALQEAEVTLKTVLPPELPPVWGSQVLLEQVLMNLLLNARDALMALPADQRRVRVAAAQEDGRVVLRVTDSGPGIPPPLLERLFEPFFTTKPQGQGTGLGLSICFGILRACGGSIQAANLPGGGAQFIISLQTAEVEDDEDELADAGA